MQRSCSAITQLHGTFPSPNSSHSHHKHLLCSRSCAALQILLDTSYKLTWLLNFQSELNTFHWQSRPRLTQSFNKEGLLRALFMINRDGQVFISNSDIHSCCMKLSVQRYEGYYHTARSLHLSTTSLLRKE